MHAPKLIYFTHRFQNYFCFCSRTFPSHVGTIFRLQWEFQWENDQKKPHLDTLGTILDLGKVIFGHFFYFGHFPIEIPIEAEKIYQHGKELS